jgi:hypothetical protein
VANAQALLSLLLTAGVFSVVANAIIAHRRNAAECKREMHGLLRLLQPEIKNYNRAMEGLLSERPSHVFEGERFED